MAIPHFNINPFKRGNGHSATAGAAYRAGVRIVDERTGEIHDYSRKQGVLGAKLMLPGGREEDRGEFWNRVEVHHKKGHAITAREFDVALPCELSPEERERLVYDFGRELCDRYGIAVDVALHEPNKGGDQRNYHAHVMMSACRVFEDGSLGLKVNELDPIHCQRARIENFATKERMNWERIVNARLRGAGHDQQISMRSYAAQQIEMTPTTHRGVHATAMMRRGLDGERIDIHDEERQAQAEQITECPEVILDKITATQAVFSRRDIARELNRYIDDPEQFQTLLTKLENSPELVQLAPEERRGHRTMPARYSTRDMIEAEQRMADTADAMAGRLSHRVSEERVREAIERAGTLSEQQREAVEHVTDGKQLAAIIGDAGTGKSYSMKVAREAWEAQGYQVRGAALAGKAAAELQQGSGIHSRTLASLEHAIKKGRDQLSARDVLVIDEAGMVGSRQLDRILGMANDAGAKVVLLGDHKQLAAIEAGAAFRAVVERVGASEITEVRRQREDWSREASQHFARGSAEAGLRAYAERDHVHFGDTREDARNALARAWMADRDKDQAEGSAIVLAHTNADVQELNRTIREARRERGELAEQAAFKTARGQREFAEGDRIVFLRNDAATGVKNGQLGTVERAEDGRLSVQMDDGKVREVNQDAYADVDHGYAVTVHKAQGVTVDRAYVLATPSMDRSLSYVAMTRHRDEAQVFAGREDFGALQDGRQVKSDEQTLATLGRSMSRERPKETTLDFAARRGIDEDTAARGWIERGRQQLAQIGQRLDRAMVAVRERFGMSEQEQRQALQERQEARQQAQAGQERQAEQEQRQPEQAEPQRPRPQDQAPGQSGGRSKPDPAEEKARKRLEKVRESIEVARQAGMELDFYDQQELREAKAELAAIKRQKADERAAESRPKTAEERLQAAREAGQREQQAKAERASMEPQGPAQREQDSDRSGDRAMSPEERLQAAREAGERERERPPQERERPGWSR